MSDAPPAQPAESVGARLERIAAANPHKPALVTLDTVVTYAELEARSRAVAARLLADGEGAGRSTALIASGLDYVIAYFGLVRAGHRAVPIEARFRGAQLRTILDRTKVVSVVCDASGRESLATLTDAPPTRDVAELVATPTSDVTLPPVDPESDLCVLFSSGSTGVPKGVILQNRAGIGRAELMARVYGQGKRHIVFTPLAYAYGLVDGILCPLMHGGTTLLLGSYHPTRLKEMVQRFQPEIFLGVPFVYKHLASMGADLLAGLPSVTSCLYYTTGEPLPRATQAAFQQRYGVPIRQNYGLSEVSAIAADLYDAQPKPSRVGKVIPGVQIRLVEQQDGKFVDVPMGEVWVQRSHRFMRGYVEGTENDEGRMQADCYRTGDIGRVDEDGYLELFGRNDDFITVAGVRIHPAEVENVLLAVPGVLEAAFVVERNAETGDHSTRAYVVIDEARGLTVGDLEAKIRAELPPSRWPQKILRSTGLPRTDTGKLARRSLLDRRDERLFSNYPVRVSWTAATHDWHLLDVSRNGCAIRAPQTVEVGDHVKLAPATHPELVVEGIVRGVASHEDVFRVSVQYVDGTDPALVEKLIGACT